MLVRRRIVVRGHVQGVGFRYAVARAARSRGVAGWVRNRADGAVEALLEGDAADVEAVIRLCRRGPSGARVDHAAVATEEPERLSGFDVR